MDPIQLMNSTYQQNNSNQINHNTGKLLQHAVCRLTSIEVPNTNDNKYFPNL